MITIYKYELIVEETFKIRTPRCFRPVHIGEQNGKIYVWAEVNTDYEKEKLERTFHCVGTGSTITGGEHLGSVVESNAPFVWHFYWHPNDESL